MTTQDDMKQDDLPVGMDAKKDVAECVYWWRIVQIADHIIMPFVLLLFLLVLTRIPVVQECLCFQNHMIICACFVAAALCAVIYFVPVILSSFKPSNPVRIAREAIWLVAISCVVIVLHFCLFYLFGDTGMGSHIKGLLGIAFFLSFAVASALQALFMARKNSEVGNAFVRTLGKSTSHQLRLVTMKRMSMWRCRWVDAFVRNRPSLVIVSSEAERAFLESRYRMWGLLLCMLALEAYLFARRFFA